MSKAPEALQGSYSLSQWEAQQRSQHSTIPPSQAGSLSESTSQKPATSASSSPSSDMVTLPPPSRHQQDLYRPQAYDMYPQHPSSMTYASHGSDPREGPPAQAGYNQPAPRQRTAIACRYCRRRKIRCHGFDQSPDGRCTNCSRFQQECVFTPVSAQTHPMAPGQTTYPPPPSANRIPHTPDGRPMYPPYGPPSLYAHQGPPTLSSAPAGPEHHFSPPHSAYATSPYAAYDDRTVPPTHAQDQKPPQHPQHLAASASQRRESNHTYEYPDASHIAPVSPATSTGSYHSTFPSTHTGPPFFPPPARRTSPQSVYSYDTRDSPQGSASSTSGGPYGTFPINLHPPQVLPSPRDSARSPPPPLTSGAPNGSRTGMSVLDILGPIDAPAGRSSADSDMLKALNRKI